MIKKGMILDINGRKGIVCGMKEYDSQLYINVGFNDNSIDYTIYSVEFYDEEMVLKKVKDTQMLAKLAYDFTMEALHASE